MPRDLSDVLHYFLPENPAEIEHDPRETPRRESPRPRRALKPAALPAGATGLTLVAAPIGERDVVRAAFLWNLAVEVARLGARALVMAPASDDPSPLWPEAGVGPLGAELLFTPATDLGSLYRATLDAAVTRAADARLGGIVFVQIPPTWLRKAGDGAGLLRWMLLFTSSEARDLRETYGLAKLLVAANPSARLGVTVHGARRRGEAQDAFARLARTARKFLDCELASYGLLVDDLHVYRAIVAQRPIGLAYPQSAAARALHDVAQLLLEDVQQAARV